MSAEEAVDQIYKHIAARLQAGVPVPEIEKELLGMGLAPELASTAVGNVRTAATLGGSAPRPGTPTRRQP
jgi:hypothetical protein